MSTYLFTWNPKKWDWESQDAMIQKLPNGKPTQSWKTNRKKNIGHGDTFILIKLGAIPLNEKGVIGIGTIRSNVYQKEDFIKDSKNIGNFVDLEFEFLSQKPFIPLNTLEEQYPQIKWTPEGSGNFIDTHTSDEVFQKVHYYQSKRENTVLFEKKIYFPIIAEEIDLKLKQQHSIHRDEIVNSLLKNHHTTLDVLAKNSNRTSLFIAQNMVDWFSAELTKHSKIVSIWQDKYIRNKVKINGREITNFSLALDNNQDEIIPKNTQYKEGSLKQIIVNAYERNPHARKKCLEYFGYSCQCCGFNFEQNYGELGKGFIHVHHLTPLSEIKDEYELNPETDLIPVCANCHAMIHRKNPPYLLQEIKKIINLNS